MSTTRRILTLTLGVTLAWAGALAPAAAGPLPDQDQPPAERFEERVEVTEVLLDVLVTDRRGNVVLGLGAEDFVVEEDGEAMELAAVTFYSNRRFLESAERARELGIEPAAVPTSRYFILFFHDQRALLPRITAQLLDAGRRAKHWVRSELLPNDYVAVAGYDHALQIHQDFTTDADAVARAIDQAVRGVDPEHWPSRRQAGEGPSLLDNLPSAAAIRASSPRVYGAMEVLARAAGSVQGRKNLVLFSLGFGNVGPVGMYTPDSRYYGPMVETLNDNNVAVYSIDLISMDPGDSLLDNVYANSLSNLSSDTGGRYYFNFVNFSTPLEQVAKDNSGYYLLAYGSRHPEGESGYQEVRVRTVNPDFRVRAREGYRWGGE